MTSFALRNVSVRHASASPRASPALSDVTLSIGKGQQVALIGSSGAGKTTLLHTLACAQRPAAGSFAVSGADAWSLSNAERHAMRAQMFLAPQAPPLPPRQRVVTAVLAGRLPQWTLWQALASLFRPADAQAAFDALARFGLQDKLYARVDRLSGGERQRCAIARLLLSRAQAFLVDEPLSALDPSLAVQVLEVLQEEAAMRGAALVCSLHQVELARAHFPRIVGLRAGRIVFDQPSEAVTDAMVAHLYRHEGAEISVPASPGPETAEPLVLPVAASRCF